MNTKKKGTDSNLLVGTTRVLSAMPTCGKTTLEKTAVAADNAGVELLDTDKFFEKLVPSYFKDKVWRNPDMAELVQGLHVAIGYEVARSMLLNERALLVTNLWGRKFNAAFHAWVPDSERNLQVDLYFFRDDPNEIVRLSEERDGSPIPLDVATAWVEGARKWATRNFAYVVALKNGEYISDFVKFTTIEASGTRVPRWRVVIPNERLISNTDAQ